jgi:hypothetical protein
MAVCSPRPDHDATRGLEQEERSLCGSRKEPCLFPSTHSNICDAATSLKSLDFICDGHPRHRNRLVLQGVRDSVALSRIYVEEAEETSEA